MYIYFICEGTGLIVLYDCRLGILLTAACQIGKKPGRCLLQQARRFSDANSVVKARVFPSELLVSSSY